MLGCSSKYCKLEEKFKWGKGDEEVERMGGLLVRPHPLYISIGEGLLVRPPLI
jgi:hypothetical protein